MDRDLPPQPHLAEDFNSADFFGSFLNHNLFLVIHELSHSLAFLTPAYNRWRGIFANLPIGKACIQGVDGIDMDIPSEGTSSLSTMYHVFNPDQETYSYYGPSNLMTWSVVYHNEHHDFPRTPGSRLSKLKEIAPEYYKNLKSYRSWSQVIYMCISA